MRRRRIGILSRLVVLLFAGAVLAAPAIGIAHSFEHHGAIDSVDCGTCHWSKNAAGTVIGAPALGFVAIVRMVDATAPASPDLRIEFSELHSRGPPAARA